jgi:hypothetical protein
MPTPRKPKSQHKKPGRPSLCTDETIRKLCEELERLGVVKYAAALAGVSVDVIDLWLSRAKEGGQYAKFATAWTLSRERSRAALVARIMEHADRDWRASAWLLERLDPATWPQKPEVVVTTNVNQGANIGPLLRQLVAMPSEAHGDDPPPRGTA